MSKPKFSLILPCYNEEEHILKSVEEITCVLKGLKYPFEVIFIDDCSGDSTVALLSKIRSENKALSLKFLYHKINQGRGKTVSDGINLAKGEYVGFIDIDCEISPSYIPEFIDQLKKNDIVVAKRIYHFQLFTFHRWVASKIYAFLTRSLFQLPIADTEAGYKFFVRKKILPILKQTENADWFWDTEILVRADKADLTIKELPVLFIRRKDKTSTVKIIPDTLKYLKSMIKLKNKLYKL